MDFQIAPVKYASLDLLTEEKIKMKLNVLQIIIQLSR